MKQKKSKQLVLKNRKAYHNYEIIETYDAGIVLVGTEIKSIRMSNVSFTDSYCLFELNELFLKNLHIDQYKNSDQFSDQNPKRDRKLLLTKKELKKLNNNIKISGLTIIPLKIYFKNGFAKIQIGLVKGKRKWDKRTTLKEKDIKRDIDREFKK